MVIELALPVVRPVAPAVSMAGLSLWVPMEPLASPIDAMAPLVTPAAAMVPLVTAGPGQALARLLLVGLAGVVAPVDSMESLGVWVLTVPPVRPCVTPPIPDPEIVRRSLLGLGVVIVAFVMVSARVVKLIMSVGEGWSPDTSSTGGFRSLFRRVLVSRFYGLR